MKTLAVFFFVLAGIAQDIYSKPAGSSNGKDCPNCFTGPTGPTLKPVGDCNEADTCAVFGGWRVGNFRVSSDDNQYVACTGTKHYHCMRCPPSLVFVESCDKCVRRNEVDSCEPYTHAPTGTPIPTVAYIEDFCLKPPHNGEAEGNFVDKVNTNWYYACAHSSTYHMRCAEVGQFFNATCNACMYPNTH